MFIMRMRTLSATISGNQGKSRCMNWEWKGQKDEKTLEFHIQQVKGTGMAGL